MKSIRRPLLVILISCPIIALALQTPFLFSNLRSHPSRMQVFRQVTLNMSHEQASEILPKRVINCSISEGASSIQNRIEFSDFWNQYVVYFHPQTHRVVRKVLMFREHKSPIQRLLGRSAD